MKKIYFITTVIGFFSGFLTKDLIDNRSAKMQTKYEIGDCISNGLYYEKIIEIRKGSVIKESKYVLLPTIQGKLSAPSTTAAWIIDEDGVKVNAKNCL